VPGRVAAIRYAPRVRTLPDTPSRNEDGVGGYKAVVGRLVAEAFNSDRLKAIGELSRAARLMAAQRTGAACPAQGSRWTHAACERHLARPGAMEPTKVDV
jgi:hypothetical protein